MIENDKLKQIKQDMEMLEEMIKHMEIITALKVFNVEIPRQSSSGRHGSKETIFGWHIDNDKKNPGETHSGCFTFGHHFINENYD